MTEAKSKTPKAEKAKSEAVQAVAPAQPDQAPEAPATAPAVAPAPAAAAPQSAETPAPAVAPQPPAETPASTTQAPDTPPAQVVEAPSEGLGGLIEVPAEDRAWLGIDLAENAGFWAFYGQSCPAAIDVLKERCRQVQDEGHSTERDDAYTDHQLPAAAICYAIQASSLPAHRAVFSWPFQGNTFKPSSRRRCLVKAAALLLAEIERLDRAEPPAT